ncbi:collagenase [Aliikangiella coralliicola]|uniref:Collagenase n=1 Tax=Aliikangiella coralliicola TaxID=2592383 RepID=A0A545UEP4_9GAMM|nr:collagenase [Aliikangiella coralliicola]TQV87947.1 collagenase [Aliikangiella coralliicola]
MVIKSSFAARPKILSRHRLFRLFSLLIPILGLAACAHKNPLTQDLLDNQKETWSLNFEHDAPNRLSEVINHIGVLNSTQSDSQQLNDLLYYLRSYYYFAADIELTEQQQENLDKVLLGIAESSAFYQTDEQALRLQENYLVALYLYFSDKKMHSRIANHRKHLIKILDQFTQPDTTKPTEQKKFTLWESLRSIAFLAYEARRNQPVKDALVSDRQLADSLLKFTKSQAANNWQFQHGVWATAYVQVISNDEDGDYIDQQMMALIDNADFLSEQDKKFVFSNRYLVNSFRVTDDCEQTFKGRCEIATIDHALPINHRCSDSLFIRANQMTAKELADSCDKLTSQESFFHELLATENKPTSDDLNDSLRVVIFDNYSQYNQHGQLLFNINTNNGGMYIEGDPSKKGNQATFYSFEAFWDRPEFSVWNLNHEYVHYLDGRFVKYGRFGHFPSKLVWWSEGLAEYVSKGSDNQRAFKLLDENPKQDWPTLATIFATKYSDGLELTYRWSYLAIRYLAEFDRENLQQLANALKNNDFKTYETLLGTLAERHQGNYVSWLNGHLAAYQPEDKVKRTKPRKLYRYLYRDYLMPEEIRYSEQHRHVD